MATKKKAKKEETPTAQEEPVVDPKPAEPTDTPAEDPKPEARGPTKYKCPDCGKKESVETSSTQCTCKACGYCRDKKKVLAAQD